MCSATGDSEVEKSCFKPCQEGLVFPVGLEITQWSGTPVIAYGVVPFRLLMGAVNMLVVDLNAGDARFGERALKGHMADPHAINFVLRCQLHLKELHSISKHAVVTDCKADMGAQSCCLHAHHESTNGNLYHDRLVTLLLIDLLEVKLLQLLQGWPRNDLGMSDPCTHVIWTVDDSAAPFSVAHSVQFSDRRT